MLWGSGMTFAPLGLWFASALFGIFVLQFLLDPLRVKGKPYLLFVDLVFAVLCLFALLPDVAEVLGLAAIFALLPLVLLPAITPLGAVVAVSVLCFWLGKRSSSKAASGNDGAARQIALSELLAMALSYGLFPIAWTIFTDKQAGLGALCALPVFAILFWRAFQRLNANKIAISLTRSAFVFCFPYMVYGCLYCSTYLFLSANDATSRFTGHTPTGLLGAIAATIVGAALAWSLKDDALSRQ